MTMADKNFPLYTKEPDGTIQKWYLFGWYGPRFSVSTVKNAKFHHYRRYFHMDDVGKTIFLSRKEAQAVPVPPADNDDAQKAVPQADPSSEDITGKIQTAADGQIFFPLP